MGSSNGATNVDVIRLAPDFNRFTRLVRAELPVGRGQWISLRSGAEPSPVGRGLDDDDRVDFVSLNAQPMQ